MELLHNLDTVVIKQQKELGEILTGFETRNRYKVLSKNGSELYSATEEGGSGLARLILKNLRPFEIVLRNRAGGEELRIRRPFRFYFHELEVLDNKGVSLGTIRREFRLLRREYSVFDTRGNRTYSLFGPLLKPWTFQILERNQELGKITKKWSGLLKEGFTDADNFAVEFPVNWEKERKALFLGAVFLIDFIHFENKNS